MERKMPEDDSGEKTIRAATRRLYFEDSYLQEFEAEVVERRTCEGLPAVVLDRTSFYPESGGQPWDKGTLGGVEVLKVVDVEGTILHVLREGVPETTVRGRIDWPTRFDHMQQHTGQHILSQAFFEVLKGETRSFHLGADAATVEIGLAAASDAALDKVEDRANAVVWEDREIKSYFVPEEKIDAVPLRRPPKKHGLLRVVEVAGYDYSACGGTHCRRSGEVGMIKITGLEKIRGNIRFEFLCGSRALADYRTKDRTIRRIAGLFSSLPGDAAGHVEKLASDFKSLKKRARKIEERLAFFDARDIAARAHGRLIAGVLEDKSPEEARFLALNITRSGEFAVLYGAAGESQGHMIFARSDSLGIDLRELIPVIGAVVPVKGGGGPSLVELVTPDKGRLAGAVEAARVWLEARLAQAPDGKPA
jgi:alanyl-tRNA synthetase